MQALLLIAALQILPGGTPMRGGLADAREPRVAIGFVATNLLADPLVAREGQAKPSGDLASDVHGVVQLGTDFPLLSAGRVLVSLQGGLISRFRLEASDNDALSSDYMVAVPVSFAEGPFSARVRVIHRSSHLGDELVQNSGIRRLEYDHEEVDALVARRMGPIRVYGGGTLTLASSFDRDRWGVQVGADGDWRPGPGWGLRAGIDWQSHSIQQGGRLALTGGVGVRGSAGTASLEGVFQTGASPIGEFFLESERYWGLQVVLERFNGR
jgi:hypothetical protein